MSIEHYIFDWDKFTANDIQKQWDVFLKLIDGVIAAIEGIIIRILFWPSTIF
jgi:hypothetical protein